MKRGVRSDARSGERRIAGAGSSDGPRKIVIGSLMYGPYGRFTGLEDRLEEMSGFIDEIAGAAHEKYPDSGLDIIALPEVIVCGGMRGSAAECSVRLNGPVLETFAAKAIEYKSYITIPLYLIEDAEAGIYRNSLALVDRAGKLAGIYHKYHPVIGHDGKTLEGGVKPGNSFPVFDCDFGRIGLQICFDIGFDDGWSALKQNGADLVIWSTQSPVTVRPRAIASREEYYIVSSTWRNNLTLFEPTGLITAQVLEPEHILIEKIDLSYIVLPWQARLRNGQLLSEEYGERVGYRYYEGEDCGIFWSNDPDTPIGKMIEETGLQTWQQSHAKTVELQESERRGD